MLLRCARCISRFAHDLLHCPQCGEAAANASPDPDVVGTPVVEPVVEPEVVPEKKSRAKAALPAEPDLAPVVEPEPAPAVEPAPAADPATAEPTA